MIRFLILLFCIAGAALAQPAPPAGAVLARAGNVFVAEREFIERFELTPGLYRHRKPQLEQEKLLMLYSMVAEKLLAQEATARSLDTTARYRSGVADLTRLLVRDELYRQEVSARVQITPAELRQGVERARQRRLLRFWYFAQEEDARFVRSRVRTAGELDRLTLDPNVHVLSDTATVLWGDADEAIEQAAYALERNGVSPVVRAGDGFYILRLLLVDANPVVAGLPSATLRDRCESTLRVRKERVREAAFVESLLRDRQASSPPKTFRIVADTIAHLFRERYVPPQMAFSPEMRDAALVLLGSVGRDTLIVAGNRVWTVREALDQLVQRGFSVHGDTVRGVAARLYTVFREWTHQELLAQEGLARGLDRHADVIRRLAPWKDHYLAGMVQRRLHERLEVSDAEVFAYLQSIDTTVTVPMVRLRVLRTASMDQMDEAFRQMGQGRAFEDVVASTVTDERDRMMNGDTGFFPVTERPPLGFLASGLEAGQFYGPFRDSSGFVYMQLLEKKNARSIGDTTGAGRFAAAREEVRRMKERRTLSLFLARTAADRGVEIYQDRLSHINVTPIPMLAYRLLGFGGRMFDVPFVQPQLDWIDIDPPREVILP